MTNFSPSSSSHLLVILNEFLQLKRDSSCCPAGCMMFISSLSLSHQQLSKAPELGAFFYAVCGSVNRFAVFVSHSFHFFSISSSSSFSSYCIYISCNFLRLDSEQFGNTHSHPSTVSLTLACTIRKLQHKQFWRGAWEGVVTLAERMCCCCWGFGAGLRRRWYL